MSARALTPSATAAVRKRTSVRTVVTYVACLVLGHAVAAWVSPVAGVALVLLTAIVSLHQADRLEVSGVAAVEDLRSFLLAFALAAIVGVVPYCLPLGPFPAVWRPTLVVVPIVAAVLAFRHVRGSGSPLSWVPRSWEREVAFGLIGVPLAAILGTATLADGLRLEPADAIAVISLFALAAAEEAILRGYLQRSAGPVAGTAAAIWVATVVGAAPALGEPRALLTAVVAGVVFGWWVRRGNGVLGPALAHGLALVGMFAWPLVIR